MSQIGLPFRIGLGAALVLVVAYLTVLKPSDDPSPAPQAPGVEGLTSAVGKATNAAATAEASNAQHEAAAGQTTTTAAPATPATPAAKRAAKPVASVAADAALKTLASGDRSEKILRQIASGRTAVVLFSTPGSSDDVAVRRALRKLDRHRGKIRVHHVALGDVAKYDAITRGVQVTQAPTLLVIGSTLKARRIVGYSTRTEINQLVNDVSGLRSRLRPSSYPELAQRACGTMNWNIDGDIGSLANRFSRGGRVLAVRDDMRSVLARVREATVPVRFKGFHAAWVGGLRTVEQLLTQYEKTADHDAYDAASKQVSDLERRIQRLADGVGLECRA